MNRLTAGVLLAAFVIGSAVLMTVYHPGGRAAWLGWFLSAGLIAAVLLGPWLLVAIWRGGRR